MVDSEVLKLAVSVYLLFVIEVLDIVSQREFSVFPVYVLIHTVENQPDFLTISSHSLYSNYLTAQHLNLRLFEALCRSFEPP